MKNHPSMHPRVVLPLGTLNRFVDELNTIKEVQYEI
jgi:hypothetical protein